MVDTVKIDSNQSAVWAQENTLYSLLLSNKVTNALLLEQAKKVLSAGEMSSLNDKVAEENKKNTQGVADAVDSAGLRSDLETKLASDRYESAINNLSGSLLNGLSEIGNNLNTADPGSVFRIFSSKAETASNSFDGFNSKLATGIKILAGFAKVVEIGYERISQLTDGYVQSYAAGVRFSDGLTGLNQAIGESGLTMQEFTGIMNKHSQSFNVLGGQRVVGLNKQFKELTNNGSGLMMTLAQSQESFMTYTDILRMSGRLRRMSDKDITAGATTYLQSINDLSAASGRSREEILNSTRDALAQPEFQAFMTTLSDGAKANLEKSITSLAAFGSDLQNEFKNFIVAGMTGGTAAMQKNNQALYMLANQTGQMPQLMKIIELAAAGKDITGAMKEFQGGIENSTLVQSGQMSRLAQFNPMFASMQQEFGKLTIETNGLIDANARLKKEADAAGLSIEDYKKQQEGQAKGFLEANSKMSIAMTELNSAFNDVLLKTIYPILIPGMEALAYVVSSVTAAFTGISDAISGFLEGLVGPEWSQGIGAAGAVTAAASPYIGYKAYKMYKSFKNGGLGGVGAPGVDDIPGMPDIPKLSKLGEGLSGFGKGVGGLGKGVGDSIAGVMKGIARGFKAFGNPTVLMGIAGIAGVAGSIYIAAKAFQEFATVDWPMMIKAGVAIVALGGAAAIAGAGPMPAMILAGGVALGAAIAAIGAGMAGAAWMLGGTLPSLAEGIRAFTDIDGANLEKVGLGMLGIGAGLLAMGAKDLISAISGFSGWIGSFFEEDPIDRLKRFGELAEPLGKAGPALDAFGTAFLNATARLNAGVINDSVTTSMDQIMSILNMDAGGMLGGEPPIIGQINSLADAMNNLNKESADLMGGGAAAATPQAPGALNSADLQKRTLAFYDNQKSSNASMIELLQLANVRLEDLNIAVTDGAYTTARTIRRTGNRI